MVSSTDNVVRLSFTWILAAFIVILIVGMAGGFAAQQLFRTPLPPLSNESDRLITTIQEVTISPNVAATQLVERANRSIFLLSRSQDSAPSATGFVLTNDGVIVSPVDLTTGTLVALDHEGRALPLTRIGRDDVYGLTYYRLQSNVVVPLDVRQDDVPVGYELLALDRSQATYLPRVVSFRVSEYFIPTGTASAIQRMMRGTEVTAEIGVGSPLLDDEGKVAALLYAPTATAYPIGHLQASLARVTSNQRESNPFAQIGATLSYAFASPRRGEAVQFQAQVASVTTGSPAAIARLQRGDSITAINEQPITWERPLASALSAPLPLRLTFARDGQAQSVTLPAAIPTPTIPVR